jgi:aryl-alcohol dehydrogenase-like predicted oxidoreductase
MDNVVLGRTGLIVSVAGLGCGGHSRLGQRQGVSAEESIKIVHGALDLGITYFDTAQSYGTEDIVGRALEGHRDEVVISTKANVRHPDDHLSDATEMRNAIESSLNRLRTETIDVFHLHGVDTKDYSYCVSEIVPELISMRDRGSIRYLALSERFAEDTAHEMLQTASDDDFWDVVMVGFNVLNPSARRSVFPRTIADNVGVEVMFAVRRVISQPDVLREAMKDAVDQGFIDAGALDPSDPLGFLVHDAGASSVIEAAYRFARHEPGCHVTLTGTGNLAHLESNVRSINLPALPDDDLQRLKTLFGHLTIFTSN